MLSKWVYDANEVFNNWSRIILGGVPLMPNINRINNTLNDLHQTHIIALPTQYRAIAVKQFLQGRHYPLIGLVGNQPHINYKYPKYDMIVNLLPQINDLCLEDLIMLRNEYNEYLKYISNKIGTNVSRISSIRALRKSIRIRIKELTISTNPQAYRYYTEYVTSMPEKVYYGDICYTLYKQTEPLMSYDAFINVLKNCLKYQPADEEFDNWIKTQQNKNWMFWDMDSRSLHVYKGTLVDSNGLELSDKGFQNRLQTIKCLKLLPYPRWLIMFCIEYTKYIPCLNNVHYGCWWVDKTIKKFNYLDTLEKKIIYDLNCKHIPLPDIYRFFPFTRHKKLKISVVISK